MLLQSAGRVNFTVTDFEMKLFDSDPSKGDLILGFCVFGRTVS